MLLAPKLEVIDEEEFDGSSFTENNR